MDELRLDMREDFLTRLQSDRANLKCEWNPAVLKWLMDASNTSTRELSDGTGIKIGSLHQYQYGKACPSLYTAVKIADYFRVPVDFLVDRCTVNECGEIFSHYADYFKVLRDAAFDAYLVNKYDKDDSMTTKNVSVYPFNLMEAIMWSDDNACFEFDEDGLEKALTHLTDREQQFVRMRFREEMTLDEISDEVQVGRERVRQVIAKACRKLRHPANMRLIQYGNLGTEKRDELIRKEAELRARESAVEEKMAKIKEKEEELGIAEEPEEETVDTGVMGLPLEELEPTMRAYNCLKRTGARTIADVAKLAEDGTLIKIRNMGRRSLIDTLNCLKKKAGLDYFDRYADLLT